MSFFAAESGFGCDNVLVYEVVLGNGTIVTASRHRNQDLFMVLKGVSILSHGLIIFEANLHKGNNNFGIVTQFTMKTFSVEKGIWGGTLVHPTSTSDAHIEALYHFGESIGSGTDLKSSAIQLHYNNPS